MEFKLGEMNLKVRLETFPIKRGRFSTASHTIEEAGVLVFEVGDGIYIGRGECVPYPRVVYAKRDVLSEVEDVVKQFGREVLSREFLMGEGLEILSFLRNGLDCALWDLEAKREGKRIWELLGDSDPLPIETTVTIDLDSIEEMEKSLVGWEGLELIKVKVSDYDVVEIVRSLRELRPEGRIVVDANEAWDESYYLKCIEGLRELGVLMIEQPFPRGGDECLRVLPRPIPVCADESFFDKRDLEKVIGLYDMVNVKLDKVGGLTAGLEVVELAKAKGLEIMVGCMVASSLSIAPAHVLAQHSVFADLDGAILLREDRPFSLKYQDGKIYPPEVGLWG